MAMFSYFEQRDLQKQRGGLAHHIGGEFLGIYCIIHTAIYIHLSHFYLNTSLTPLHVHM